LIEVILGRILGDNPEAWESWKEDNGWGRGCIHRGIHEGLTFSIILVRPTFQTIVDLWLPYLIDMVLHLWHSYAGFKAFFKITVKRHFIFLVWKY